MSFEQLPSSFDHVPDSWRRERGERATIHRLKIMKRGADTFSGSLKMATAHQLAADMSLEQLHELKEFIDQRALVKKRATLIEKSELLASALRELVMTMAYVLDCAPIIVNAHVLGNHISALMENEWEMHIAPCYVKVFATSSTLSPAAVYAPTEETPEDQLIYIGGASYGASFDPLGFEATQLRGACRVAQFLWRHARHLYEGPEAERWYGGSMEK